jgi:hypothetical protein
MTSRTGDSQWSNQAEPLVPQHSPHAAATIVTHDQNVADPQHLDRILQHREIVSVLRWSQVGNIAMHEDHARIRTHDFVGRHAAVGTADP